MLGRVLAQRHLPSMRLIALIVPHADAAEKFPECTAGELAKSIALSEVTRRKILWDNPARLYGIRETPNNLGTTTRLAGC
jgi:hypothetical protein